jgi:hypothetical protein
MVKDICFVTAAQSILDSFRENAGQLGNVYRNPPRATSQPTLGLINVAFLCEQLLN